MTASNSGPAIPVRIRAADGKASDDGWVRTAHRPFLARLGEGAVIAGGGTGVGVLLLPIPLVHIFGVTFALTTWWFGLRRMHTETVVVEVGGTCPRCQTNGTFYAGFGRKRFRLPISTSCPVCAHALSLEALPGASAPRT